MQGGGQGRRIRKVWGLEKREVWKSGQSYQDEEKLIECLTAPIIQIWNFTNIENPKYEICWATNSKNLFDSMAKPIRLNFVADQAQQSKVFIVPFWLLTYLGIFFGEIKQLRFISLQIKILVTALLKYRSEYLQAMIMEGNHKLRF